MIWLKKWYSLNMGVCDLSGFSVENFGLVMDKCSENSIGLLVFRHLNFEISMIQVGPEEHRYVDEGVKQESRS